MSNDLQALADADMGSCRQPGRERARFTAVMSLCHCASVITTPSALKVRLARCVQLKTQLDPLDPHARQPWSSLLICPLLLAPCHVSCACSPGMSA